MALRRVAQLTLSSAQKIQHSQRLLHATPRASFFWFGKNKPVPTDDAIAVGYEKIVLDAAKIGEDPLEVFNRDQPSKPTGGDGSKNNPFLIPSPEARRYVLVKDPDMEGGTPPGFWVTLEEGGRCPVTGQHYKLDYSTEDKWGVSDLDLFKH